MTGHREVEFIGGPADGERRMVPEECEVFNFASAYPLKSGEYFEAIEHRYVKANEFELHYTGVPND